MELITEWPIWLGIFSILLGAAYAYIFYRKDSSLAETKPLVKKAMAALRFLSVALISFLLLSPLLKSIFREVEKPLIVIAQDYSKSITLGKDSTFYKETYLKSLGNLRDALSKQFDVRSYAFGEKVSEKSQESFTDRQTDISSLFEEIQNRFSNRNLGAIVVASDGLYNEGINPVYAAEDIKVPIYSIALGDTSIRKDLVISQVNFNKIAYLGNNFPIEAVINAKMLEGQSSELTVSKDGQMLFKKNIDISNKSFHINVPFFLEAKTKGMMHYKLQLSALPNEVNTENNTKDIYIEILENKEKILILGDAPNPDMASMTEALESNQNYEVTTDLADHFTGNVKEYNLVILHGIPSKRNPSNAILGKIKEAKLPVLYVINSSTSLSAFNQTDAGLSIQETLSKTNEVVAGIASDFSLFVLSEECQKSLPSFPPLKTPFGNYQLQTNPYVLLYQQVGNIKTQQPLLMFTQNNDQKSGVLCGEGIWKWKLFDFSQHENHQVFNEIINKSAQYLSAREDKGFFRIRNKHHIAENEMVHFDAEVYNKSYELMNTEDVSMSISGKDKKTYAFTFSKTEKAYTLDAGYFPPGDYTYQAKTKLGDALYTSSGAFSVSALQIESSETVANHQLMNLLASKHDGKMVYPNQMEALAKMITDRSDIKSISFTQKKLKEVIHLKLIFFIILSLLTLEWFMRKRNGSY